jgi:hypothetical protein
MFPSVLHSTKSKLVTVELSLPSRAHGGYRTLVSWGKIAVSTLLSLRLPIYCLEADESDDRLEVIYLGAGTNLNLITHMVCGHVLEPKPIAHTSLFRLHATIDRMKAKCDLMVIELPHRLLRRLLHRDGFLVIPWVGWQIKTQRPWDEIEQGFHRTSVRSDLKKLEESAVQCLRTQERSALERFYWDTYRPFIHNQHGDMAEPTPLNLLRSYFDAGWLTLYIENDQLLGGAVQYVKDGILYDYVMGFKRDISRRQQTAAATANYYDALHFGWEMNCEAVDFGLTRPLLNDGVARYKRKWGSTVTMDSSQNWGLWIHVSRNTAQAVRFLTQHPWIWIDRDRKLRGLLVIDNQDRALSKPEVTKACKRLWAPGLHSVIVYATRGFTTEVDLSHGPIPAIGPATEWDPLTE